MLIVIFTDVNIICEMNMPLGYLWEIVLIELTNKGRPIITVNRTMPCQVDWTLKYGEIEMVSRMCAFLSLCFLTMSPEWPVFPSSRHSDFIVIMNDYLELWDKETLSPIHCFTQRALSQLLDKKVSKWKQQITVPNFPRTLYSGQPCSTLIWRLIPCITASGYAKFSS